MAHGYPIGKAQATVLSALGLTAVDFADAERIFAEIGIQVASKRGVPVVTKLSDWIGYFGADGEETRSVKYAPAKLDALKQWMA
jgi:hypothetical protein